MKTWLVGTAAALVVFVLAASSIEQSRRAERAEARAAKVAKDKADSEAEAALWRKWAQIQAEQRESSQDEQAFIDERLRCEIDHVLDVPKKADCIAIAQAAVVRLKQMREGRQ